MEVDENRYVSLVERSFAATEALPAETLADRGLDPSAVRSNPRVEWDGEHFLVYYDLRNGRWGDTCIAKFPLGEYSRTRSGAWESVLPDLSAFLTGERSRISSWEELELELETRGF